METKWSRIKRIRFFLFALFLPSVIFPSSIWAIGNPSGCKESDDGGAKKAAQASRFVHAKCMEAVRKNIKECTDPKDVTDSPQGANGEIRGETVHSGLTVSKADDATDDVHRRCQENYRNLKWNCRTRATYAKKMAANLNPCSTGGNTARRSALSVLDHATDTGERYLQENLEAQSKIRRQREAIRDQLRGTAQTLSDVDD